MTRLILALLFALAAAGAAAQPIPTAAEQHPGLKVEPLIFTAPDGTKLRAVVTAPPGPGRKPAILYVQPLSCDTVAIPQAAALDGWQVMLQRLVRESGAVVWRMDKRGVGGSEGDCAALDYETELADHRAALEALRRRPEVDPAKVFVYGASMGANLAPLLAQGQDLAGVVVWGGGARTWAERTLAFERNRLELGGTPPAQRAAEITSRYRLIQEVIIDGRAPSDLAAWRKFAGADERGMYGRSFAWHRQAQRRNWAEAWTQVKAPVLALFGEYDWFEDASGVQLIGDIVGERATVMVLPGLDHHFSRYPSRRAAFAGSGGTVDPGPVMDTLLPWLRVRR